MNPCFSSSKQYQSEFTSFTIDLSRLIVRQAKDQDLASLADILADSFHTREGIMRWIYPFLRMGIYEDLRHRLRFASGYYVCLAAIAPFSTAGGPPKASLVGTVEMGLRFNYWQPQGSQYLYISNLAVRRECRRQGVAAQLLNTCERMAIDWGFSELYLHVLENNHKARRLYFKLGYRLQRVEGSWTTWLLKQPRRMLLRKTLVKDGTDAGGGI